MNLILLKPDDLINHHRAILCGRRLQHIRSVIKPSPGQRLRCGVINGAMGQAEVVSITDDALTLSLELTESAPAPLPVTLLLALPRPKVLRRVLQTVASLGVKEIVLLNAYRVEKSYWQSPFLVPEVIEEQLILGLEQAVDTRLPRVTLEKRFKPFVEDRLPALMGKGRAIVAHPKTQDPFPARIEEPLTLAVGPEGGFIDYEVEKLVDCGFECKSLGKRILKVETVLPYLLSRSF